MQKTRNGQVYNTWVMTKRNDLGQKLEERQKHSDNVTRYINYTYIQGGGKAGELKYVYFPSNASSNRIQWTYDSYHRPASLYRKISGTEIRVGQWTWNDDGTPSWFKRGNNIDTSFEYDTIGRVLRSRTIDDDMAHIVEIVRKRRQEMNNE